MQTWYADVHTIPILYWLVQIPGEGKHIRTRVGSTFSALPAGGLRAARPAPRAHMQLMCLGPWQATIRGLHRLFR